MTTSDEDTWTSSPSLVAMALYLRRQFFPERGISKPADKVIMNAEEVARIYHANHEQLTANELDVLFEVLHEFGIITAHAPPDFHMHVANVVKSIQAKDRTKTKSHVIALIFSRL